MKCSICIGGVIYNRVMNKIYRRNIVESVLFPVDRQLMEDAYWTSKVLSLSHRITILPEAKYYYRKVNGSLSHRKKYTQFQKAGMHRNKLEKYRLLATYCSDKLIESKLGDLERELNYIFISNNDLSMFDVINCVRQLICIPIFTTCHNKSFDYIRSNLYSNHLHERYLLRLIFRINSNLKIRILALHRLIKMKER